MSSPAETGGVSRIETFKACGVRWPDSASTQLASLRLKSTVIMISCLTLVTSQYIYIYV